MGRRARSLRLPQPIPAGIGPVAAAVAAPPAAGRWTLAALPMALILPAAVYHGLRPAALTIALGGALVLLRRADRAVWVWLAVLPALAIYVWGLTITPTLALPGLADCTNPLSPPALWRFLETCSVLGLTAALAVLAGTDGAAFGLRLPGRRGQRHAALAGLATAALIIPFGGGVGRQLYGSVRLADGLVWALLPALLFAGSNAVLEEVVYRGALLGWSRRVIGTGPAIVLQAVAFGLAHAGPDFVGSALPVVLATGALGLVGGFVAVRTGSLLLPIAVHLAFDLPLYFLTACRVP